MSDRPNPSQPHEFALVLSGALCRTLSLLHSSEGASRAGSTAAQVIYLALQHLHAHHANSKAAQQEPPERYMARILNAVLDQMEQERLLPDANHAAPAPVVQ